MSTVAEALTLAKQHLQGGDLQRAEMIYRQILQVDPSQVDALHFLGVIAHQVGKHGVAVQYMEQSVALAPSHGGLHYNLGSAYQALGKNDQAAASFREAIRLMPNFADAHNNLGNTLADQEKLDEAIACYRRALALKPQYATAHYNLGNCFRKQGHWEEAAACYRQALTLKPDDAKAHLNLGNVLLEQNQLDDAVLHYQEAVRFNPRDAQAHNNLGNALQLLGRLDDAAASYLLAVQLQPDYADAHYNLGHVFVELKRLDEASASYSRALALNPNLVGAHASLATVFAEQGCADEAVASLEQAVRLQPAARLRIALATRLPVIYQSMDELESWRERLIGEVRQLREQHVVHDLTEDPGLNLFYLAFQGLNDREIQTEVARLYREGSGVKGQGSGNKKIQVGFISTFFRNHTIGHWMRGLVAQLSRDKFTVTVLSIGRHDDEIAKFFKTHCDRYLEVPKHLPSARKLIAEQKLDVLFYADIGMSPLTYSLAFSRLAPVQCVTLGHPVTTGISTIDYFISSEQLETAGADQHYSEKLVQLKMLPIYYYRTKGATGQRSDVRDQFGLTSEDHVYVCPQSLFKFHPEFDALLGGILRGDPRGVLVLSQGVIPQWPRLLRQRFAATLPDLVDRIRFLPALSYADYLNLLAASDVQLDTVPFGGGNTSYDGLTVGTPIVTMPTQFMRGRITSSLYRQMGILDCVAGSPDEYIKIALRLGTEPDYRNAVRESILEANDELFENNLGIRELEHFLEQAVLSSSPGA
jgi:protein O-GlcNAc transferase